MNIAVRYYSRSGNTKRVADAIAETVEVIAGDCSTPLEKPIDLLFLGAAVYGFGLDEHIKDFIAQLNPENIKSVALFGTSAMVKTGNQAMAALLKEKNIPVMDQDFHCKGTFTFMNRGRPNQEDLKNAAAFAKAVLQEKKLQ